MDKITALRMLLDISKTLVNEQPAYFKPIERVIPPAEIMMFPLKKVEKKKNPFTGEWEYPAGYEDEDKKNKDSKDVKDVNKEKKGFEDAKDENKEKKDSKDMKDVKKQDNIISNKSEDKKDENKEKKDSKDMKDVKKQDNVISTNSKNNKDDSEEEEEEIDTSEIPKWKLNYFEPKEIYHMGLYDGKKEGEGSNDPFIPFIPILERNKYENELYRNIKIETKGYKIKRYTGYVKEGTHAGYLDMALNILMKYIIEDLPVTGVNVEWRVITFYFRKTDEMLDTAGDFINLGGQENYMAIDVHMKSKSFRLILGCRPHAGFIEHYDVNNNYHVNARSLFLPENKHRDVDSITKECVMMEDLFLEDEDIMRVNRFRVNTIEIYNKSKEFIRRKAISVKRKIRDLSERAMDAILPLANYIPDFPNWFF